MQFGFVATGEEPGRLEHNINLQFFPRQVRRIAVLQDSNFVPPYDDVFVVITDFAVEFAMH